MEKFDELMEQIINQADISLKMHQIEIGSHVRNIIDKEKYLKFYAFYGINSQHQPHLRFRHSNLAGSYFLGRINVENSIVYKSDIRGDELKHKGETFIVRDKVMKIHQDELISIKNSILIKTLVHSHCHNPDDPTLFLIKNTIALPYSNIHGSHMYGAFLEPFSTVDLTTVHDCVIGAFSYVQVGELAHKKIEPGKILIRKDQVFQFEYQYDPEVLKRYISYTPGESVMGMCMDYMEDLKDDFEKIFQSVNVDPPKQKTPEWAYISRYAVYKNDKEDQINKNVLIAQRAHVEATKLDTGANAQENCYISHSSLGGYNVTAHGATIIYSQIGKKVFVGFNSFLHGKADEPLIIGENSIVMPHTIIHTSEPITIPPNHLIWGHIRSKNDLKNHTYPIEEFSKVDGTLKIGKLFFKGSGKAFIEGFIARIIHILQANGAFYDGSEKTIGHAQTTQATSYNIIQPYHRGAMEGLYPTIEINP